MSNSDMSKELRALLAMLPPGWEGWTGVSGLLYARKRLSSPPIVFRAVDADSLAKQVSEYEAGRA